MLSGFGSKGQLTLCAILDKTGGHREAKARGASRDLGKALFSPGLLELGVTRPRRTDKDNLVGDGEEGRRREVRDRVAHECW